MGAVETLIIWENMDVQRIVLKNPEGSVDGEYFSVHYLTH